MPPDRTKPTKTTRTHLENKERAYIAASRRSDRSLEARVESARKASEIHKQRTGKSLRVTEQDVENEEMYEEEDGDLASMRNRAAQRQFQANQGLGFESRLHDYFRGKVVFGDYIGALAHAGNVGMNASMYGATNPMAAQMMPAGFPQQFMGQLNPSAYVPYASTDEIYQQKMAAQFVGHNPSQYLPMQHPPRSLQAPGPRMMQNMGMMNPQWAFAQQRAGMQFLPGGFNHMFMRPDMHPPTTSDQVRSIEQQQRDILTQRMAEAARRASEMEKMKTLNQGASKPEQKAAVKAEPETTGSPIKTEASSNPLGDDAPTVEAAPTPAPVKSLDTKHHPHLSLNTPTTKPTELGPFTSGLPAEALQFDMSEFATPDGMSEAMLYRQFPMPEEYVEDQHHLQQTSSQQQPGGVAFSDPFANRHTPIYEQEFPGWYTDVGPTGELDFESFLAPNESHEVLTA